MMNTRLDAADVVEITQVMNLYGHLFDKKTWDRLGLVFTADAVVDYSDAGRVKATGLPHIQRHMTEVPPSVMAHTSQNIYVWVDDGTVRGRSKFIAPVSDGTVFSGVYEDVLVRTDDGWRIKERVVRTRRSLDESL
jgi:hypothetical protein